MRLLKLSSSFIALQDFTIEIGLAKIRREVIFYSLTRCRGGTNLLVRFLWFTLTRFKYTLAYTNKHNSYYSIYYSYYSYSLYIYLPRIIIKREYS